MFDVGDPDMILTPGGLAVPYNVTATLINFPLVTVQFTVTIIYTCPNQLIFEAAAGQNLFTTPITYGLGAGDLISFESSVILPYPHNCYTSYDGSVK